ncbi:MAG: immunity 49 family protein, partial [Alteromonadales bacterium]|nr:immunity 49 family protein [Alteromonadales bacterium]
MIDIKRDYKPMSLRRNTERFGDMYIKSATTRRLKIKKENLIALSGDAIRICQWWSFDLTEENKKKSFKALKIAAKASEAIFRLGRTPDKEQQIVIDDLLDARYDGQGLLKGGFLTAMDWQEAFFTAAIVRDKAAMDSLVKFPVSLMRQCSSKKPEAEYLLTELLQSIHRRDPHEQFMAHLKKAMQQVTEDGKKEPWVEYGTGAKLDFIIAFITNNETSPSEG